MPDDAELLALVAEGDRGALTSLYDRHGAWLVVRLSQRCDDRGLVDETVQDTFVRVWRRADTWRGDGEVGAWIWGIALRRLIDGLRRRTPIPVAKLPHDRSALVVAAEDEVLTGLSHGRVGSALEALSPELQAVLRACVLDGLTHVEAAALLGVPVGTVKSRLHRARVELRGGLL